MSCFPTCSGYLRRDYSRSWIVQKVLQHAELKIEKVFSFIQNFLVPFKDCSQETFAIFMYWLPIYIYKSQTLGSLESELLPGFWSKPQVL